MNEIGSGSRQGTAKATPHPHAEADAEQRQPAPPHHTRHRHQTAIKYPSKRPPDPNTAHSIPPPPRCVIRTADDDADDDAMMQHNHHHQHVQQQQQQLVLGVSLPMATTSSFAPDAASAKPRPSGLPPTPPPASSFAGHHRHSPGDDVCMDIDPGGGARSKAHRRSRSDVLPSGYFYFPPATSSSWGHHLPPPKVEPGWGDHHGGGGDADDLFNTYLNLEGFDGGHGLNSSDERHDDGDSRGSSVKTNGADSSENESEECATDSRAGGIRGLWGDRREGLKRTTAAGDPARHARSLSMDSLIGKLNFSAGAAANNGVVIPGPNRFCLEFGSGGEFTPVEMKKIMADEKLAEMALADPKRVKRVLANRQSAARSKERKMRYMSELEQRVQILQTEATTLSAQLTLLQRDSAGIATQNNQLKFRLQAMEQQAQLRDALNEALTAEVQRLKLATAELGDSCSSNNLAQQLQRNAQDQMFQLHQQATPIPFYHESKE